MSTSDALPPCIEPKTSFPEATTLPPLDVCEALPPLLWRKTRAFKAVAREDVRSTDANPDSTSLPPRIYNLNSLTQAIRPTAPPLSPVRTCETAIPQDLRVDRTAGTATSATVYITSTASMIAARRAAQAAEPAVKPSPPISIGPLAQKRKIEDEKENGGDKKRAKARPMMTRAQSKRHTNEQNGIQSPPPQPLKVQKQTGTRTKKPFPSPAHAAAFKTWLEKCQPIKFSQLPAQTAAEKTIWKVMFPEARAAWAMGQRKKCLQAHLLVVQLSLTSSHTECAACRNSIEGVSRKKGSDACYLTKPVQTHLEDCEAVYEKFLKEEEIL